MSGKKRTTDERLAWLEGKLEELTGRPVKVVDEREIPPEERADYIPFGSPEHAGYLGIVEVESEKQAKDEGFEVTYKSPKTGKLYRLADELGASVHHPEWPPEVAAKTVLRQKVSAFESGPPPVPQSEDPGKPNYAPEQWQPDPETEARLYLGLLG